MDEWVTQTVGDEKKVQLRHHCPTGPPDPLGGQAPRGGAGGPENVRPTETGAKYLHGASATRLKTACAVPLRGETIVCCIMVVRDTFYVIKHTVLESPCPSRVELLHDHDPFP